MGNLGAMEKMLDLIRNKLSSGRSTPQYIENSNMYINCIIIQKLVMMFWNTPGRPCGMSLMKPPSIAKGSWMEAE